MAANTGFNISFDYRFDTNGYFTTERRNTLEAAARIWESFIQDDFPDLVAGYDATVTNPQTGADVDVILPAIDDLLIFVGFQSPPFGNAGSSTLGKGGFRSSTTGSIFRNRVASSNFEPWIGNLSFDPSPRDGTIDNWFFDQTPGTAADIPPGKVDFLAVALHEIAHVLGLGTANISDLQGDSGFLDGFNARLVNNGQPIPLETDLGHFEEGIFDNSTLADPIYNNNQRTLPTVYDLAWLADIGYDIRPTEGFDFVAQGTSIPLATNNNDVTIFGTILADTIDGLGGDDQLQGNQGDDKLLGGIGDDKLFGQAGQDSLLGGDGDDYLDGGDDNDRLDGGGGDDSLWGKAGIDRFYFGLQSGKDTINDFDIGTEVIEITAAYGFADGNEIFATLSKPFSNVSQFNLSDDDYIRIFHDSQGGTPLSAANFSVDLETGQNQAPTAVTLINALTTLAEDQDTTNRTKVADITITDDALGTNTIFLSGNDAPLFEVVGRALYLKAGAILDVETNPQLNVTVAVDDDTVGTTPDVTADLAIAVTDVNEVPPPSDVVDQLIAPMYRLRNDHVPGTYLFVGEQEAQSIAQNPLYSNFINEGFAFAVATSQSDPLLRPFYRFANT
ncbi:MAG: hypothetical protein RLZZ568_95, partial [Cyanobacteriota bacterium]